MGKRKLLCQQRQHGNVGEVEQSDAQSEHQERPAVQQHVPSGGSPVSARTVLVEAASALVIDGAGRDGQHGQGREDGKERHEMKHGALAERPADQTGDRTNEDVPSAVAGGVAAQPLCEAGPPDEAPV
jgi:hypothetical protein